MLNKLFTNKYPSPNKTIKIHKNLRHLRQDFTRLKEDMLKLPNIPSILNNVNMIYIDLKRGNERK